ncbi:MAG: hypothetical protein KA732_00560 [Providencia sp.]|uniref:hypothetical protein n=1 Tax=Providencia sp. TaxID=589 RepID=UPI001B7BA4F4|nr:hypothetical protein [Providencia sp.]MBP6079749.1 hypothetical protein [Providencia sp.]
MKEEAKEIVQAVSEAAKDRIKNPVMATFVISWCVFNWNSLLVLIFGNDSIQQKVQIASVAFSEKNSWFIPIFFTTIYLFLNKPLNLLFQKAMVWFDYISMSIEHSKKIKELELEKERESSRAEKDMAYEDTKTNKEKEIQEMKEKITQSQNREGELVNDRDDAILEKEQAIKEKKDALQKVESIQIEINSYGMRYSKIESLLSELVFYIVDKEVDNISGNISNGLYDNMKNILKSSIFNSPYVDVNHSMDFLTDKFNALVLDIPDIELTYKEIDTIFSKHLKCRDFINSLNLEQLMYVQRKLSK